MMVPGTLDVKENGRGSYLRENIPNARPFSVLIPGTLNLYEKKSYFGRSQSCLVGSCSRPPEEVVWKGVKEQRLFRAVSKSYTGQKEGGEDIEDHTLRQSLLT